MREPGRGEVRVTPVSLDPSLPGPPLPSYPEAPSPRSLQGPGRQRKPGSECVPGSSASRQRSAEGNSQ